MSSARIVSLHIYPIKSCQGIDVPELQIQEFGPQWDREWMIVDEKGQFLTQRTVPKLAQIETAITADELHVGVGEDRFKIALDDYSESVQSVKVWSSELMAHRETDEKVHAALSDFLGRTVSLVRYGPLSHREATRKGEGLGAAVRFSDKTAVLVTNTLSLADLNVRLSVPIPMGRFRPNVVVEGELAWQEDQWKFLRAGSVELEVSQACGRCPMITIDQKLGVSPSKEPLTKLSEFRRRGNAIEFGVVVLQRGLGSVVVGDEFMVD